MSTLTIDAHPTLLFSIKRLIARHPFLAFFTLAFAGTWLLDLPMVLGQDGLGLLPYHMPFVLYAGLFLLSSYAGPTLAALLVTAVLEGKAGVRHFVQRYGQWRVGARWYLVILVGYPLFFLGLVSLGLGYVPVQALAQHWSTLFTLYLPSVADLPCHYQLGRRGWLARFCPNADAGRVWRAANQPACRVVAWRVASARLSPGRRSGCDGTVEPVELCPQHAGNYADHGDLDVGFQQCARQHPDRVAFACHLERCPRVGWCARPTLSQTDWICVDQRCRDVDLSGVRARGHCRHQRSPWLSIRPVTAKNANPLTRSNVGQADSLPYVQRIVAKKALSRNANARLSAFFLFCIFSLTGANCNACHAACSTFCNARRHQKARIRWFN